MNVGLAWILWIAAVVGGAIWVDHRGAQPDVLMIVASRALPQNTLLLPGQLVPPAFEMTYVVRSGGVTTGQALSAADLGAKALLLPGDTGSVLASVAADWSTILGGLNAGSKMALCRGSAVLAASVTVQAVQCAGVDTARRCAAVFALPTTARDALDAIGKPGSDVKLANSC